MKIYFEYFGQAQMCSSASQAVEFINSLHCLGNPKCQQLVVNERTRELLEDLFQSEWTNQMEGHHTWPPIKGEYPYRIPVKKKTATSFSYREYCDGFEIRTTGCSSTSIRGYYPLGETVEGHKAELLRRLEAKKARQQKERDAFLTKRNAELNEVRKGWYSVSLTYRRMRINSMKYVESTFSGKCIAESGLDAFRKLIDEIEKDGEASLNAIYPEATSLNYEFVFLGVKTDDGYTFKEWEDEA